MHEVRTRIHFQSIEIIWAFSMTSIPVAEDHSVYLHSSAKHNWSSKYGCLIFREDPLKKGYEDGINKISIWSPSDHKHSFMRVVEWTTCIWDQDDQFEWGHWLETVPDSALWGGGEPFLHLNFLLAIVSILYISGLNPFGVVPSAGQHKPFCWV